VNDPLEDASNLCTCGEGGIMDDTLKDASNLWPPVGRGESGQEKHGDGR
jgi:hypothetical protein